MTLTLKLQNERFLDGPFIIFKQNVTEKEFWEFATEDIKCELIDGVLVIHSPASPEHEDIFSYLITLFRIYLDSTGLGKVFGSRLVMRLSDKWNPEPDIFVITPNKYKKLTSGRYNGPADLVIEILSDSTRENDIKTKLPQYIQSGVGEVWIIDPKEKKILTYSSGGKQEYSDPGSSSIIESVSLPNFRLQVNWIWNRNDYPTDQVIDKLIMERAR